MACAPGINIVRHPDYNYPPTDPSRIKVYTQGMTPAYPFVIIGRITFTVDYAYGFIRITNLGPKSERKILQRAALVGADGIIFTDVDVNIYAFNQYVTTEGYATMSGDSLSYFQVTRPHATYYTQKVIYGYLIKATWNV